MTKWIHKLLATVLALCGGLCTAEEPPTSADLPKLAVGDTLPTLNSTDHDGRPWNSTEHACGKILVLYLYPGDFTGGCIKQSEVFREGLAKLEARGVELVGISGDEADTHQLFKESYGLKHTLLADSKGELAKALGAPVGRGGKVRARGRDGKMLTRPMFRPDGTPLSGAETTLITRPITLPRWTVVVDLNGTIASIRRDVNPATDAKDVLEIVDSLTK